jgi:DNA polymerase III delta prime subunit
MNIKPQEITIDPNNPYDGNRLFRNEQAAKALTQIVKHTQSGYTLSINADWGYGKTTFVKMWNVELQKEGYKTIYFNAWESDFVADPMMALIDGFREGFDSKDLPQEKLQLSQAVWKAAAKLTQLVPQFKVIGEVAEIFQNGINACLEDQNKLQEHQSYHQLILDFKEQLTKFSKEISPDKQLIIFVDELDRCRPDYAVQMLERIKHFFSIDNVIFVLSIDKNVLCKSIRAIYGGLDIDTEAYLRRFIDLEFNLPKPNPRDFIKLLYDQRKMGEYMETYWNWNRKTYGGGDKNADFLQMIRICFASVQQSLRDIEKYIARLDVILRSFDPEDIPLSLVVFLLYFEMFHPDIYDCFRNRKCEVNKLWEEMEKAYLNNIPEGGEKDATMELLIQILVYYCKWEMTDENYGTKDTSLYKIITLNEVDWLPEGHRVEFKNRVTKARAGDFGFLFDRIELIAVDFNWKDIKGVMAQ